MKREGKELDRILDQVIDEIREEEIDSKIADEAAARVWNRIRQEAAEDRSAAPIQDCEDYRAMIPAYLANRLSDARALLLEDHTRECVLCRKALKQARSGGAAASAVTMPRAARRRSWNSEWSWAVAAAILVAVALVGIDINVGIFSFETGGMVTVRQVEGMLLKVTEEGAVPVSVGEQIRLDDEEGIRTAKDSQAILELSDGSLVEMNERSQLAVYERRSRFTDERKSSTIALDRGNIIVEAADQGSGRLSVETDDCEVAVKGTVFAVNHGLKGSRVSVIEGEVEVDSYAGTNLLLPGDQLGTSPRVGLVPLEDEIAWSSNVDRHLALLQELTQLGKDLDQVIQGPEARHSTRLLDRAPSGTVVYAAIPNISGTLSDAYTHMRSKIDSNPILLEWWERSVVPSGADAQLDEAVDKIRAYGDHFGDEIVLTLQTDSAGQVHEPLVLAELSRPAEFREYLVADLLALQAATGEAPNLVILEGAAPGVTFATHPQRSEDFYFWIQGGFFAASPSLHRIETLAANVALPESNTFVGTAFHSRLADVYREGVEWALGVDLARMIELDHDASETATLERMGLLDLQHLIVERRDIGGKSTGRAVLSFDQPRRGLASWLAAPAPMGSLDFISPEATLVAAFVMKTPASVVDELLSFVGSSNDNFERELAEFEQEQGLDVRKDFAAPLGGEFAFALDGPMLPKPSWKFVIEVYDPAQLQRSLELAVERLNEVAAEHDKQGFVIEHDEAGGRTFHTVRSLDTGIGVHYTFADGYLVATPSRVLLDRALGFKRSGFTIGGSPRFVSLLPQDGRLNFSAVVYQNLGSVLGPVAQKLMAAPGLSQEQVELMETLVRDSSASLAYAYGEQDRITVAATSEGGFFSSGLKLFSLQGLLDMQQSLGQAIEQGSAQGS